MQQISLVAVCNDIVVVIIIIIIIIIIPRSFLRQVQCFCQGEFSMQYDLVKDIR